MVAADPDQSGRTLFHGIGKYPNVMSSAYQLLAFAKDRTEFNVCGYLIHYPRIICHKSHLNFWQLHTSTILEYRQWWCLEIFIPYVHTSALTSVINRFCTVLHWIGWLLTKVDMFFPDFGDTIDGYPYVILGVHILTHVHAQKLLVPTPPQVKPMQLKGYLYPASNKPDYTCVYSRSSLHFVLDPKGFIVTNPIPTSSQLFIRTYNLVQKGDSGCGVMTPKESLIWCLLKMIMFSMGFLELNLTTM